MEETAHTLGEMREIARRILTQVVNSRRVDRATALGLRGELGAGKTAFTKQLAELLGVQGPVKSPTFVLQLVYDIPVRKQQETGFHKLVHIDAYRMEGAEELEHLGWNELVADPKNLIVIEWPERVESGLTSDVQYIQFTFVDENTRSISI